MSYEVGGDWPDFDNYQPLESPHETRILTVLPGSGLIECTLTHSDLGSNNFEPYTALSYAWGKPGDTCDIRIDGQDVQLRRTVREFLASLRRLAESQPVRVWIDVICINQRDKEEKSRQVSMMHKIFSLAAQVIVWLGEATLLTNMAFEFLHEISQLEKRSKMRNIRDILTQYMVNLPVADGSKLPLYAQGLHSVYDHAVWTRLWILQEVVLGEAVTLLYGDQRIQLSTFLSLIQRSQGRTPPIVSAFQVSLRLGPKVLERLDRLAVLLGQSIADRNSTSKTWDLSQLLRMGIDLECSDSRDKIYGILSMADSSSRKSITVDYAKSLFEVFCDTFIALNQGAIDYKTLKLMSELYCRMEFQRDLIRTSELDYIQEHLNQLRSNGNQGVRARLIGRVQHCVPGDPTLLPICSQAWYRISYDVGSQSEPLHGAWSCSLCEVNDECFSINPRISFRREGPEWTDILIILRLTNDGTRNFVGVAHTDQQSSFSSSKTDELLHGSEIILPLPKYVGVLHEIEFECTSEDYEYTDDEVDEQVRKLEEFNRRRGRTVGYKKRWIKILPNGAALLFLLDVQGNKLHFKKLHRTSPSPGQFSALASLADSLEDGSL